MPENSNYIKTMLNHYLNELKYLKFYVITLLITIAFSYSIYLFLSVETVSNLGEEDNFFEWATTTFLFIGSILLFILFFRTKNIFYLLLSISLFFGCGEEISWGQRIIGFKTPPDITKVNVQNEFNLHNLVLFSKDFNGIRKKGLNRLLEINFLFRLFTILYGIVLPIISYHINIFQILVKKLKLPVPPISIGIFFLFNWLIYWILHAFLIPGGNCFQYYDTAGEIFECLGAFILLLISLYFFIDSKLIDKISHTYKSI